MNATSLPARCRSVAMWAGPLAIASVVLVIGAEVTSPGMLNPVGTAGAVAGLLAGVALVIGTVGLHVGRGAGDTVRRGDIPFLVMLAGGVLAAGGMWDMVFTLPVLAAHAPALLEQAHPSVLAGFLLSYGTLGAGALAWTISMRRQQRLTAADARWLVAGSVVCFTPLPTRFFLLAVAVSIVAARADRQITMHHPVRVEV
ncbi:hypothetical protein [Egicoccus sp. AB-alg6-2]|uniref:hypothetical protein n=1 Tax=Egicoccus sp. AB-alg6-2 TaxID=3242692 RepID=UPI00359E01ED